MICQNIFKFDGYISTITGGTNTQRGMLSPLEYKFAIILASQGINYECFKQDYAFNKINIRSKKNSNDSKPSNNRGLSTLAHRDFDDLELNKNKSEFKTNFKNILGKLNKSSLDINKLALDINKLSLDINKLSWQIAAPKNLNINKSIFNKIIFSHTRSFTIYISEQERSRVRGFILVDFREFILIYYFEPESEIKDRLVIKRFSVNLSLIVRPCFYLIIFDDPNKGIWGKLVLKLKEYWTNTKRFLDNNPLFQRVVLVWKINLKLNIVYLVIYLNGCLLLSWNILIIFSSKPIFVLLVFASLLATILPYVNSHYNRFLKQPTNSKWLITVKKICLKIEEIIAQVVNNHLFQKIPLSWRCFMSVRLIYLGLQWWNSDIYNLNRLIEIYNKFWLDCQDSSKIWMTKPGSASTSRIDSGFGSRQALPSPVDLNNPQQDYPVNIDSKLMENCLKADANFNVSWLNHLYGYNQPLFKEEYNNKINKHKSQIWEEAQEIYRHYQEYLDIKSKAANTYWVNSIEKEINENWSKFKERINDLSILNSFNDDKSYKKRISLDLIGKLLERRGEIYPGYISYTNQELKFKQYLFGDKKLDKLIGTELDVQYHTIGMPSNFNDIDFYLNKYSVENHENLSWRCLSREAISISIDWNNLELEKFKSLRKAGEETIKADLRKLEYLEKSSVDQDRKNREAKKSCESILETLSHYEKKMNEIDSNFNTDISSV